MKILTITLNPAFDVHINITDFKTGAENYATGRTRQAGGKGVNISRALASCGVDNTALVLMGEKGADEFSRRLDYDGVKYIDVLAGGEIRENITLHSGDGTETRISLEGTGINDDDSDKTFDRAEEICGEGDIVAFAGRIPSGLDRERLIMRLCRLSSLGVKLCIDSNSFTAADYTKIKPWLIKPNEFELSALAGSKLETRADFASAAQTLVLCGTENVIVSLGGRGALLIGTSGRFAARPPKINVISTIGAGDSTLAGFISARKDGKNGGEALSNAVAWGSAKCLREGTLPPTPADVASVLSETKTESF